MLETVERNSWLEKQERTWAKPVLTLGLVANLAFGALQFWIGSRYVTKDELHQVSTQIQDKIDRNDTATGDKIDKIYLILIDLTSRAREKSDGLGR